MAQKRRSNGEGTVYKRKDGYYCAQETLDGRRISGYGKTKTAALASLKRKVKEAIQEGSVRPKSKNATVGEYIPHFLKSLPITNNITKTNYGCMGKRISKCVGSVLLNQINDSSLVSFCGILRETGYAPGTINLTAKFFERVLKKAQEEGYVKSKVKLKLPGTPFPEKKKYILPPIDDVIKAINGIRSPMVRAMALFCLYTGLRRGELIALKWADINLDTGVITVQRSYSLGKKHQREVDSLPKNRVLGQIVQIPNRGIEILNSVREYQQDKSLNSEYVFCTRKGKRFEPSYITSTFKVAISKVSSHGSVHILRHLHATILAREGIPLITISKQLRHSSVVTTNIYINSLKDESYDDIKEIHLSNCSSIAVDKSDEGE